MGEARTDLSCYLLEDSTTRDGVFFACSTRLRLRREVEDCTLRLSGQYIGNRDLMQDLSVLAVHVVIRGSATSRLDLRPFLTARLTRGDSEPLTFPLLEPPSGLLSELSAYDHWRLNVDWSFVPLLGELPRPRISEGERLLLSSPPLPPPSETDLDGAIVEIGLNDVELQNVPQAREVLNYELDYTRDWLERIRVTDPWPT